MNNVKQENCSSFGDIKLSIDNIILAALSSCLLSSDEAGSSYILSLEECKRRMQVIKKEKVGDDHTGTTPTSVVCNKDVAMVKEIKAKCVGCENSTMGLGAKPLTTFERFPQEFMDALKATYSIIKCEQECERVVRREKRLSSPRSAPPRKKRKKCGPPIPQLGRPFQKKVVPDSNKKVRKLQLPPYQCEKENASTEDKENSPVEFDICKIKQENDFEDGTEIVL